MKRKGIIAILGLMIAIMPFFSPAQNAFAEDRGNETDGAQAESNGSELGVNILVNPGFEEVEGSVAQPWIVKGGWDEGKVKATPEAARTGQYGLEENSSWAGQVVEVQTGKPYEFTGWMKCESTRQVQMKIEYFHDTLDAAGFRGGTRHFIDVGTEWEKNTMDVTIPAGVNIIKAYFMTARYSETCHFDDAALYRIQQIPGVNVLTNNTFYYQDESQGSIYGTIWPSDQHYQDKVIDVEIYPQNGGDPIVQKRGIPLPASGEFDFQFDPSLMTLHEPYTVKVSLNTEQGEKLFEKTQTIYRWERPTSLRKNGTLIINGKAFFPIMGYHVPISMYPYVGDTINTVQTRAHERKNMSTEEAVADILNQLDEAQKYGLKVILSIYNSSRGAQYIKDVVGQIKGHPALLGWYLSDEPDLRSDSQDEQAAKYRAIRSVDKVHPTFMVVHSEAAYKTYGRVTDILATDIYPLPGATTAVGHAIDHATDLFPEKQIWSVLQTFHWPNDPENRWPYLPTIKEVRNMTYQSILEGAKGLGYYSFTDREKDPTWNLLDSELNPGLVKFKKNEMPYVKSFVLDGKEINSFKDDNVQWGLWKKGDQLYAIVVNLTKEQQQATISLPKQGYKYKTLAPQQSQDSIRSNQLSLKLSGLESILIQLTPFTALAEKAKGELQNGKSIIDHPHWAAYIETILQQLQKLEEELSSNQPDMNRVTDRAVNVLRHLDNLEGWLNQQKDIEGNKEEGLNLIDRSKETIQVIVSSELQTTVNVKDSKVVAGDLLQVQVHVQNTGEQQIKDSSFTVQWPKAFEADPQENSLKQLKPGQSKDLMFQVKVPENTETGDYQLPVQVSYLHHGVEVSYVKEKSLEILPLTTATLDTEEIKATKAGDYPVSFELKNNASHAIDVTLEGEAPENLSLDLDSPLQIEAGQTAAITGTLHIDNSVPEDEYSVTIYANVGGKQVQELSIAVEFNRNLLVNPGFEVGGEEPERWGLGRGKWVQDVVHSGQYAVALLPDVGGWNHLHSLAEIDITPGKTYKLSGWVKIGSPDDKAQIGVREIDTENSTVKYDLKTVKSDNSEWARYEMEFVPTSETQSVAVYLVKIGDAAPVWFDDLRIEEID